ncbi:hypothetical protein [Bogoriella caseilytica]|uniref:Uncharacterized protein n=1 Tax=Bogoriella caseilytica TaxID=56055 RepID=A0A3N2BF27_9MICO|nr:hypothetical protein [Bogoriella caseilytica]ROR73859.1 hypothetical protein EDD31_2250 [Bogoriella caseilytica]
MSEPNDWAAFAGQKSEYQRNQESSNSQHRHNPYGDGEIDPNHHQQRARQIREGNMAPPPGGAISADSGLMWALTMRVMPYVALLAVMVYWLSIAALYAEPYRDLLVAILPDAWFVEFGEEPQPWAVAGVVGAAAVSVGILLLVVRRRLGRAWAHGVTGTGVLWWQAYPLSVLLVLLLALTPGLFLGAGSVAQSGLPPVRPGMDEGVRSWPVILTLATALWWAIGSTRRAVRRAVKRRFRGWWQAPDGEWYPPGYEWGPPQQGQQWAQVLPPPDPRQQILPHDGPPWSR